MTDDGYDLERLIQEEAEKLRRDPRGFERDPSGGESEDPGGTLRVRRVRDDGAPVSENGGGGDVDLVAALSEAGVPLGQPERFGHTDDGNARRLAHYFGRDVRYVPELDRWYVWDDKRWQHATPGHLLALARQVADRIDTETIALPDDLREAHRKWATTSHNDARLAALVKVARGVRELWADARAFDADPYLLNCLNGVVDVRTRQRHDHDRSLLLTKLVPHRYVPDAEAPTWRGLVARTFQQADEDDGDQTTPYALKLLGYSAVVGANPEQVVVFVVGEPDTGKTQVIEVPAAVLGPDYAHKAKTELIARVRGGHHSSERLSLVGRRYVYVSETNSTYNLDEAVVKELTGDREVTTYTLYAGVERSAPVTWTIWLATNEFPNVLEWDGGIQRRVLVLPAGPPLPRTEQDRFLQERVLRDEAEGVLAALVEGAHAWWVDLQAAQADAARQSTGLAPSPAVAKATADYARSQDVYARFCAEWLEVGADLSVPMKTTYDRFQRWRGRGETGGRRQLYAAIRKLPGVTSEDGRVFQGVGLRPETISEAHERVVGRLLPGVE